MLTKGGAYKKKQTPDHSLAFERQSPRKADLVYHSLLMSSAIPALSTLVAVNHSLRAPSPESLGD